MWKQSEVTHGNLFIIWNYGQFYRLHQAFQRLLFPWVPLSLGSPYGSPLSSLLTERSDEGTSEVGWKETQRAAIHFQFHSFGSLSVPLSPLFLNPFSRLGSPSGSPRRSTGGERWRGEKETRRQGAKKPLKPSQKHLTTGHNLYPHSFHSPPSPRRLSSRSDRRSGEPTRGEGNGRCKGGFWGSFGSGFKGWKRWSGVRGSGTTEAAIKDEVTPVRWKDVQRLHGDKIPCIP